MASEPISKLLGDNAELRPLAERLQYIKRLQKRYRTLAPENLASASRVCAIDGTTVVVCAASGPVAAALRHLALRRAMLPERRTGATLGDMQLRSDLLNAGTATRGA